MLSAATVNVEALPDVRSMEAVDTFDDAGGSCDWNTEWPGPAVTSTPAAAPASSAPEAIAAILTVVRWLTWPHQLSA